MEYPIHSLHGYLPPSSSSFFHPLLSMGYSTRCALSIVLFHYSWIGIELLLSDDVIRILKADGCFRKYASGSVNYLRTHQTLNSSYIAITTICSFVCYFTFSLPWSINWKTIDECNPSLLISQPQHVCSTRKEKEQTRGCFWLTPSLPFSLLTSCPLEHRIYYLIDLSHFENPGLATSAEKKEICSENTVSSSIVASPIRNQVFSQFECVGLSIVDALKEYSIGRSLTEVNQVWSWFRTEMDDVHHTRLNPPHPSFHRLEVLLIYPWLLFPFNSPISPLPLAPSLHEFRAYF